MGTLFVLTSAEIKNYTKKLRQEFKRLNSLHWGDTLPDVAIEISGTIQGALGCYQCDKKIICIHEACFLHNGANKFSVAFRTLLHEMVHLGLRDLDGYHDEKFQRECNRIGNFYKYIEVSEAFGNSGPQCQLWPHNVSVEWYEESCQVGEIIAKKDKLLSQLSITTTDTISVVLTRLRNDLMLNLVENAKKDLELAIALLKALGVPVDLRVGAEILRLT